jgi:hypothetical protein
MKQLIRWMGMSCLVLLAGFTATGCDSSEGDGRGACASTNAILDECVENRPEEECLENNDNHLNGGNWTWHEGTSCDSLGYTTFCNYSYIRPTDSCP